jgi:hypothetical protein
VARTTSHREPPDRLTRTPNRDTVRAFADAGGVGGGEGAGEMEAAGRRRRLLAAADDDPADHRGMDRADVVVRCGGRELDPGGLAAAEVPGVETAGWT